MLRQMITEKEYEMIDYYRMAYAHNSDSHSRNEDFITSDVLLGEWDRKKSEYLSQMFGDKLILKKDISYTRSYDELAGEMNDLLEGYRSFGREQRNGTKFYRAWCDWLWNYKNNDLFNSSVRNNISYLMSDDYLIGNIYAGESFEIPLPNGKNYKVNNGAKTIKILSKIASAFELPGFEDFRICHSQVLNQKTLNGTLHISIHPLDYMTMSDNSYGWESCMSWYNEGGYRQGTVEMMNSRSVVVAYLAGEDPYIFGKYQWNNKKWRQLFVVDRDVITSVKSYPYFNENLTKEVLKWLKDLATENLHWTYEDITEFDPEERYERDYLPDNCNNFAIEFSTGYMYSDFGSSQHFMALNDCLCEDSFSVGYRSYLYIPYSGNSQCMICGDIEPEFEDDGCLACRNCEEYSSCDHCGGRAGETYYIDGMNLCDTCYDEHVCQCSACERDCYDENMRTIYIIPRVSAEMMEKLRIDYKAYHYYVSNLAFINDKDTQFIYRKNHPQVWLCNDSGCFEDWIEKYLKPEERPHQRLNQWSENSIYVYFDQLNEAGREEFAWGWHDMESFMNSMNNQNIVPTTPPELI